jgi:hypothetical protein
VKRATLSCRIVGGRRSDGWTSIKSEVNEWAFAIASSCRFLHRLSPRTSTSLHTMQAAYPLTSPPSPIRSRRIPPIPGFRVPPKPKPPPIKELTIRELRDLYDRNAKVLAMPSVIISSHRPCLEQTTSNAQFFFFFFWLFNLGRPPRRRTFRA